MKKDKTAPLSISVDKAGDIKYEWVGSNGAIMVWSNNTLQLVGNRCVTLDFVVDLQPPLSTIKEIGDIADEAIKYTTLIVNRN